MRRENEEREWVEVGGRNRNSKPRGYVHRLDQVATSIFFTNFPEDVKAVDLWPKFAHFGRVGEVYIPDKLDKQGRRFGFVKFRDVKNAREQLDLISNIWIGSFKLRVNLSRFAKGAPKKTVPADVSERGQKDITLKADAGVMLAGRSFKEVLAEQPVAHRKGKAPEEETGIGVGGREVVWEVEVEPEALARLKGAFVGVLSEDRDPVSIQRSFVMDGYHHFKITPLGYMKVLISSSVEGEVQEVVGSVGWWSSLFERFEEWSPSWVSNQRITWLHCFGVPLHTWGVAIFRSIGFKFGKFIDIDSGTKSMLRGDVAKIQIETDSPKLIDSSISVVVLGKKFMIRVVEEVGGVVEEVRSEGGGCCRMVDDRSCNGSGDGSMAVVVEGESEEGGDSDWSEGRQGFLRSECHQEGKGKDGTLRLLENCVKGGPEIAPTSLGNTSVDETDRVNLVIADRERELVVGDRAIVVRSSETAKLWENVPVKGCHVSSDVEVLGPRDLKGSGSVEVDPGQGFNEIGDGPVFVQPKALRTKKGDIPLSGFKGGGSSDGLAIMKNGPLVICSEVQIDSLSGGPVTNVVCSLAHTDKNHPQSLPTTDRCIRGRTKKAVKKSLPYPPGNNFFKYCDVAAGGAKSRKKKPVRVEQANRQCGSEESDPIESPLAEFQGSQRH
ncbi:polyadenylate-binding protein RBP45 [Trifolium repens]|nr:polyadenylate-binding protein RBP45 [Trifolium repens]